jgi:hypothetical protein
MVRVKELINLLNSEYKVYVDIYEIAKKKKDVLVKGQVKELENLLKVEETLVIKMGKLENLREQNLLDIASSLNIKVEDINVSNIVKKIDPLYQKELKQSQENLVKIIDDIKNINEINTKLIQNSLEFIDFSINVFANASESGENNYGSSGKVNEQKTKTILDMKL